MRHSKLIGKIRKLARVYLSAPAEKEENPPGGSGGNEKNDFRARAEYGEDKIMEHLLFRYFGVQSYTDITYLEVGTCSPDVHNVTYWFYERGSRGVLVEPNPELHAYIKEKRPEDVLIEKGISVDGSKEMTYYDFGISSGGLNTFSKEQADYWASVNRPAKNEIKIPMVGINELLDDYFMNRSPDILLMDAEGMDFEILKTVDFERFDPKIVCMEVGGKTDFKYGAPRPVIDYMDTKNYALAADTLVNLLFVNMDILKRKV